MPGWGPGPWGLGPWGAALHVYVVKAWAVTIRTVRVYLSGPVLAQGEDGAGDALNTATWNVHRLDTPSKAFTVTGVEMVETGVAFDVTILEQFGEHFVPHEIGSTTLLTAGGLPIGAPQSAQFDGVQVARELAVPQRSFQLRDLKNPPWPESPGGTLHIDASGDYASESGAALVRKLIARRLFIPKGGFFHLSEYGIGLAVKQPLPIADLVKLRKEIVDQVKREPEVEEASAKITTKPAQNTVQLVIQARLRNAAGEVELPVELPTGVVLQ